MQENTHVVISSKRYEEVLNFLSTQSYNEVAQLISSVVQDASTNGQAFDVVAKSKPETK